MNTQPEQNVMLAQYQRAKTLEQLEREFAALERQEIARLERLNRTLIQEAKGGNDE